MKDATTTATLQYVLAAFLAVILALLVITGHDGSQVTIGLSAGLSLIIGVLFTNATRDIARVRKQEETKTDNQGDKNV